jgi:[ribosomal protein S5]-alanine N-acetyltransferase
MAAPVPRRFDQLTLRTARLLLRPLRHDDAHALFGVFSDPQVMRYWSSAPWTDVERAREMIGEDLAAMARGEYIRLGLETRERNEIIGTCTLFDIAPQCRRAQLGYALERGSWGRGYMHEALVALLGHGFAALDLNRIEADVDPRNLASTRSLVRLGFRKEGHLRERWIVGGEVSDSGLYGLLRRDWAAGAAPGVS